MAIDRNIKTFTAADIERYHRGLLSSKEMHDLEKAALDDPFLADALEGYSAAGANASADIDELKKRLSQRTNTAKVIPISRGGGSQAPWLRVAAMIILVAGAGLLVYRVGFSGKNESPVAQQKDKKEAAVLPLTDTSKALNDGNVVSIDTPLNTINLKKTEPATTITGATNSEANTVTKEYNFNYKGNAGAIKDTLEIIPGIAIKPETTAPVKTDNQQVTRNVPNGAVDDKRRDFVNLDKNLTQAEEGNYKFKNATANKKLDTREQYNSNLFRGQVVDNNQRALPFANITNTRDNVGTYSDANGFFTLTSPDSVLDVQIRSLGYNNYNYRLRNDIRSNQVMLQEDNAQLSEVVISNRRANSERSRTSRMVLEEPEPVDGWYNYDTYIANNLNEPEALRSKQVKHGEVEVSFEVDKDGKPINITVDKSLCESCDKEAIRLVKEGPKFKRKAKKKGRTTVTISF